MALNPKQEFAFFSPATEILYGGAAGGGKSFLARSSAIRWCCEVPGIQVYLFRRTLPDLRDNHLRGPTSFQSMLGSYMDSGHVKGPTQENELRFWNGSVLHLCYCDSENDVTKYQGAEIHVLIMDELTHFSEYQYRFLRSRVRLAGLKIPEKYKGVLPRIECASNPGSIGHAWVKRTFISPQQPEVIWRTQPEEGGMLRQYIPAKLSDNRALMEEDPNYANRLMGLGSDSLVKAMLDGDWDIVAGQAFEKLDRKIHCIEPFDPPDDWLCFGSLDWGSSRPFSFGAWTVSNGNMLPDGRLYPSGAIIRFNEWYGWNGKPNEGLRMEVAEVCDGIKERLKGRKLAYISADPSMWKVDGGPSHAESFSRRGLSLRKADNSRIAGYLEVRGRIAGNENGAMLYATKNCHAGFWRTMPDIVMDENHTEDIDCWVAGTMISTENGEVPIEHIKVGDFVNTPIGACKVLKSYVSGASETIKIKLSNGKFLEGTPHHKIYVENKGLIPLSMVECSDILTERNSKWKERLLFSEVLLTTSIKKAHIMKRELPFIVRYGLKNMVRYLTGITYTIKMEILQTIGLKTLSVSVPMNMQNCIVENESNLESDKKNGQALLMGKEYSWKISKNAEIHSQSWHYRAVIVESLLNQTTRTNGIVQKFVKTPIMELLSSVLYAVRNLRLKGTAQEKCKPVHIVAVGNCEEKKLVYNLTVDKAHLFYANGILSSNTDQEDHCADDVRYACMSRPWAKVIEKKNEPVDRWARLFNREPEQSWKTA